MIAWHQRGTLRFRLALWYAVVGSLLLAGFSATLYLYVRERMAKPLDHQLRVDLAEVHKRLEILPDRSLRWSGREIGDGSTWMTDYPWFELWDENGNLVRRLWPFAENRVHLIPSAPARDRETISVFSVAPDLRLRVLSVPYPLREDGQGPEWMIRLMRVHEPVADALGALRWIIFFALPTGAALLALGGSWITNKWLMPLQEMATTANGITVDSLSVRLPVENPHDEAGRLGSQFNITLDRLEASFNALDRFVADASHELRTPLTTLRSVGEIGLRKSRSAEEYREIIGSMLEEAGRLEHLIGRLLELATAEAGASDVHRAPLRMDLFVRECIQELEVLADARGQRIAITAEPIHARTDPLILRQALQNLIENAVKFSPEGAPIGVRVRVRGSECEIVVEDEGQGITAEAESHLTERFFRADAGRSRSGAGFGLGLSITKAYMRLLGGRLEYNRRSPAGSAFTLVIPKE